MFKFWQNSPGSRAAEGPDQRRSIRYRSGAHGVLGWWEGESFRSTPAVLVDISEGGAAVLVGEETPGVGASHLRICEGGQSDWIEVEVRAVRPADQAHSIVHLKFAEGCCYSVFRAALPGTALDGPGLRYDVDRYDSRHWR